MYVCVCVCVCVYVCVCVCVCVCVHMCAYMLCAYLVMGSRALAIHPYSMYVCILVCVHTRVHASIPCPNVQLMHVFKECVYLLKYDIVTDCQ